MKVGIVGLGVMGGSLLMALSSREDVEIVVVSRGAEGRAFAAGLGAVAVSELSSLPGDLDFCFLAAPSKTLVGMATQLSKMGSRAIISDMASSKSEVVPSLTAALKGSRYLSCHPMCGSEKTGLAGARKDLYDGKTVVLTPNSAESESLQGEMERFWGSLGCRCVSLSPQVHDRAVAWVSHMPHLLIPALINAISVAEACGDQAFEVAGTGLRDISRLASSNPELWRDIIIENQASVKVALDGVIKELQSVRADLDQSAECAAMSMELFLKRARETREARGLADI